MQGGQAVRRGHRGDSGDRSCSRLCLKASVPAGSVQSAKGEASDEDEETEYFDAMEDAPAFITVTADPKHHRRSGSNLSGASEGHPEDWNLEDSVFESSNQSSYNESTGKDLLPRKRRRTRIPDKPNYSLNLWSIMKNCIGKELSKIPMPVSLSVPGTRAGTGGGFGQLLAVQSFGLYLDGSAGVVVAQQPQAGTDCHQGLDCVLHAYHGIVEWFGWEGTLKLIQSHPHGQGHLPLSQSVPMSSLALGTARDPGCLHFVPEASQLLRRKNPKEMIFHKKMSETAMKSQEASAEPAWIRLRAPTCSSHPAPISHSGTEQGLAGGDISFSAPPVGYLGKTPSRKEGDTLTQAAHGNHHPCKFPKNGSMWHFGMGFSGIWSKAGLDDLAGPFQPE
uniref:Uncharacterized protein n=1 Tax=Zonotrichia albicollis TaxID=44394 RepID=A0A8D2M8F3_ZONAL